jgi:hypothetical protein
MDLRTVPASRSNLFALPEKERRGSPDREEESVTGRAVHEGSSEREQASSTAHDVCIVVGQLAEFVCFPDEDDPEFSERPEAGEYLNGWVKLRSIPYRERRIYSYMPTIIPRFLGVGSAPVRIYKDRNGAIYNRLKEIGWETRLADWSGK